MSEVLNFGIAEGFGGDLVVMNLEERIFVQGMVYPDSERVVLTIRVIQGYMSIEQQARGREMQLGGHNYPASTSFVFVSSSILRRNWDICECRSSVFWNKKHFHNHKRCNLTCSVDRFNVFGVCKFHLDFKYLQSFGLKSKQLLVSNNAQWGKRLTCSSSGSGSGNELMRYSICFALTIKSVTISFWLAEKGIHYDLVRQFVLYTFKNVRRVVLVRISLFRYGYFWADLEKIGASGEIGNGVGHDHEHLDRRQRVSYYRGGKHTF